MQRDETGYFRFVWRPVDEMLSDLKARNIDVSDFNARVEKCKENLVTVAREGRLDVNALTEDAQHLAILGYVIKLPQGSWIETQQKVYYAESVKGLLE